MFIRLSDYISNYPMKSSDLLENICNKSQLNNNNSNNISNNIELFKLSPLINEENIDNPENIIINFKCILKVIF